MSGLSSRRRLTACLIGLCIAAVSGAVAVPSLRVECEDLRIGNVEQGDRVPVCIVCENTEDGPLDVEVARVSCGACTHARGSKPEARIAPGAKHTFELTFDSSGKIGPFAYYLELKTNDPKRPRVAVRFSGQVVRNLELETYAIHSRVPRGTVYERTIVIRARSKGCRVVSAEVDTGGLRAALPPHGSGGVAEEWELRLRGTEGFHGELHAVCTIRYETGEGETGVLHIPVDLEEEPDAWLAPPGLTLATVPAEYASSPDVAETSGTVAYRIGNGRTGRFVQVTAEGELAGRLAADGLMGEAPASSGTLRVRLMAPVDSAHLPLKGIVQCLFRVDGLGEVRLPLGVTLERQEPLVVSPSVLYFRFPEGGKLGKSEQVLEVRPARGVDARLYGWRADSNLTRDLDVSCEEKKGRNGMRMHVGIAPRRAQGRRRQAARSYPSGVSPGPAIESIR